MACDLAAREARDAATLNREDDAKGTAWEEDAGETDVDAGGGGGGGAATTGLDVEVLDELVVDASRALGAASATVDFRGRPRPRLPLPFADSLTAQHIIFEAISTKFQHKKKRAWRHRGQKGKNQDKNTDLEMRWMQRVANQ